jgi:predicted metal-binding membrane protein
MSLKQERLVIYASMLAIILLAWVYLVTISKGMGVANMGMGNTMPTMQTWKLSDILLTFVMWSVMMVAMMIPSAAPVVTTYTRLAKQQDLSKTSLSSTGFFLLGYIAIWTGFSLAMTGAQWILHTSALLSPQLSSASPILGGVLLVVAGIYQVTPLKETCLTHCRTPLGYLLSSWRDGSYGAFQMGARHGIYCLGCCWMIMALLFVGGVMNLLWVAILAFYILIEKVTPAGNWINRVTGIVSIGFGIWILASTII